METINDLKIQLRANYYTGDRHCLEYRIDPNQDIRYKKVFKLFWCIPIPFIKITRKYDTSWHQPSRFNYNLISDQLDFDDPFNWGPYWCDTKEELETYKSQFKTYGDLLEFHNKEKEKAYAEWKPARYKYLKNQQPIY